MDGKRPCEDLKRQIAALEKEADLRKDAERKFKNIFHKSLDALMIIGSKNREILSANKTTGVILGFQEQDLKGKPFSILYPPSETSTEGPSPYDFQVFGTVFTQAFLRSDGSTCLLDLTATLIDWDNDKAIMVSLRDASERKLSEEALRDSEEKLRTITETAKDAVIMLDEKGTILFWNPAAETIFGYTGQEIIGKDLGALIAAKKYHEAYLKAFEIFKNTGHGQAIDRTLELDAMKKDATEFPVEISLSTIHTRGKDFAVGIVRDISDRKRMEKEQKELIQQLQEALSQVKKLGGLLPICASCKKIRDDKGYWNQIESYIRDHSEADFSHGICPECAKKLYPEMNLYND